MITFKPVAGTDCLSVLFRSTEIGSLRPYLGRYYFKVTGTDYLDFYQEDLLKIYAKLAHLNSEIDYNEDRNA